MPLPPHPHLTWLRRRFRNLNKLSFAILALALGLICAPVIAYTVYQTINGINDSAPETHPTSSSAALPTPTALTRQDIDAATATLELKTLEVTEPITEPRYKREHFGESWADTDSNGCDTRNDVLARDLSDIILDEDGCRVLAGVLADPYTGTTLDFRRSGAVIDGIKAPSNSSNQVQIDHIVALKEAWVSGASAWNDQQRLDFANDTANLLAVSGEVNQVKSAQDASTWLVPDNPDYRCAFATQYINIKTAYRLTVDTAEKQALKEALASC